MEPKSAFLLKSVGHQIGQRELFKNHIHTLLSGSTAHPRSQGSDTSMLVSTGVEGLICVFWFELKLT